MKCSMINFFLTDGGAMGGYFAINFPLTKGGHERGYIDFANPPLQRRARKEY